MKKTFVILLVFFFSILNAYSAKFKIINVATDKRINKLYQTISPEWSKGGNCLKTSLVKVLTPTAANGRTPEELKNSMTKESIHKYVTSWFDEGITLNKYTDKDTLTADISIGSFSGRDYDEEIANQLHLELLKSTLNNIVSNKNFIVFGGSASGNNTSGEVFAVYDNKNDEILSLVNSNFASDSECGD